MENLKGRRFKIVELYAYEEVAGLKIGDEGVVLNNDCVYPYVRMDKYNDKLRDAKGLCEDGHGVDLALDQIELLPEEWTPKFGEKVLAWNKDGEGMTECILLFVKEGDEFPYNVVTQNQYGYFNSGVYSYKVSKFKEIMRFTETITKAEAEAQLGKKIID